MTPAEAIAMLDDQIARNGQTLKFKRGNGQPVSMRGFVRGFKPDELVGTLKQGDRIIVLSPSTIGTFGVPQTLDKVAFLAGSSATVQSPPEQVHMDDVLVRINVVVRGD
jgi:hypothetical protein